MIDIITPRDLSHWREAMRLLGTAWPDAVVGWVSSQSTDDLSEWSMDDLAAQLPEAEFFIYRDGAAMHSLEMYGVTPANNRDVIHVLAGPEMLTWVFHGPGLAMPSGDARERVLNAIRGLNCAELTAEAQRLGFYG